MPTKKIKKILIANRGEIACRIIATCKTLGIETVSIYSEGEENLPHTLSSDYAICLGGGPLSETYLNVDLIVGLAKKHACDAIHPGYGLLSERAKFAKKIQEAKLIFIGPPVSAIEVMGDKKSSKIAMEKAGVPVIPGHHGDNQDPEFLYQEAKKIGVPVLIKASAGGGGKGMRLVEDLGEFKSALESCQREAQNAFGDKTVLLEKYISGPRHIEVQVFSDQHGNHLHFFERECSIQRRHQKVIEETPSPALDHSLRQRICSSAVLVAKSINYVGAGTVEFMLDDQGNFYFLEMNTRLQVEHPITEMTTLQDLVALQIAVAQGEALPLKQEDIKQHGHSLEVRIYAEDPDHEFLPQIGKINFIGESQQKNVRLDTGHLNENEVGINFDPMLAKLIVWGRDRQESIKKMCLALEDYPFLGIKTNRSYLRRVLEHPAFISGKTFTHFLQTHRDDLTPKENEHDLSLALAAYLLGQEGIQGEEYGELKTPEFKDVWSQIGSWRNV